jgi:hypothetical protein
MPDPPTRYDLLAADGDWIDSGPGPDPEPTNPLEDVGPDGTGDTRVLHEMGQIKYDPQVPAILENPHFIAVEDYLTRMTMEFDRISKLLVEITGMTLGAIRSYVAREAKRRLYPPTGFERGNVTFRASGMAVLPPFIPGPQDDDGDDEDEDPRPVARFRTPAQARAALEMVVQVDTDDEPHHDAAAEEQRRAIAQARRARFSAGLTRNVMLRGTDPIDDAPTEELFAGVNEAFPERRPPEPDPIDALLESLPPGTR